MLSGDALSGLGNITGSSQKDVKSVLSSALPSMLHGADKQANDSATAQSFVNALSDHAKDDTADIGSFLSKVDIEDGGKIIGHLLGSQKEETTKAAAGAAGIDASRAGNIMSAAAPLIMSLIGQQISKNSGLNNADGISALIGDLLGGVDLGSLLGTIAGSGESGKKSKSSGKGGLLGSLLGFFRR